VFVASNALEFLCSCAVKLIALDRMSVLLEHGMRLGWDVGGRVVMGLAAAGCAAVIGGNIAAAAYFQTASNSLYASHALPPHARNPPLRYNAAASTTRASRSAATPLLLAPSTRLTPSGLVAAPLRSQLFSQNLVHKVKAAFTLRAG
jgi:hypothetical protein